MATLEPESLLLAPLDNVLPRRHVVYMLFFRETPGWDLSAVEESFRNGLNETFQALPQLSGTIRTIDTAENKKRLCVSAPWRTASENFHVKDLRHNQSLEFANLRQNHFPLHLIEGDLLFPLDIVNMEEKPVVVVQMNVVRGGLLVAFGMHHSFADASGSFAVARIWAAYCSGADGSALISEDMLDRERTMAGRESGDLSEFPEFMILPPKGTSQPKMSAMRLLVGLYRRLVDWIVARMPRLQDLTRLITMFKAPKYSAQDIPQFHSTIVFFSDSRLAELKKMASAKEHKYSDVDWISTNDALCSLLTCCLCADKPCNSEKRSETSIGTSSDGHDTQEKYACAAQAVNLRGKLEPPLPSGFLGNVISFLVTIVPAKDIKPTPAKLAELAHLIRQQLNKHDGARVRRLAAALDPIPDLSRVCPTPPPEHIDVFAVSSWSNQKYSELNWGHTIGSRVERVRCCRPNGPNPCIIMPRLQGPNFNDDECGLEIMLCFERNKIEYLKQDPLFNKFAQWRCI